MSVAQRLNGKAGGAVAQRPIFFHLFESQQVIPMTWYMARQVHIPKVGMISTENQDCKKIRPITILSVWYRVWSGGRLKSVKTQQWLRNWWPKEAIGGGPMCELHDALFCINDQTERDEFLCSLDYSLAFDHTHPKLVTNILRKIGMHESTAAILEKVWTNQLRFMQFDDVTGEYPQRVSSSLPQGDAWSLIGMVLTLAEPTKDIITKTPGISMCTFVDDRTFTAKSAEDLLHARDMWTSWSQELGLQENYSKAVFFHKKEWGKSQLISANVPHDSISDHPKILGHELKNAASRGCTDAEQTKWQEAITQIQRARWLPVAWHVRKATIARGFLAKAVTGWFWRRPTQKIVNGMQLAISSSLGEAKNSSVYLRHLLRGHDLHVQFTLTSRLLGALWRQVHKRPNINPINWNVKGFLTVFTQLMSQWAWKQCRPGDWSHENLGDISFHHPLQRIDHIQHQLRESFRIHMWTKHHNSARRDAYPAQPYHADFCQWARRQADFFPQFQVLVGGLISPACYSVQRNADLALCPTCNVACDIKRAWICPEFLQTRQDLIGDFMPRNEFSKRTGWLDDLCKAEDVLRWLLWLRKHWLTKRWGE